MHALPAAAAASCVPLRAPPAPPAAPSHAVGVDQHQPQPPLCQGRAQVALIQLPPVCAGLGNVQQAPARVGLRRVCARVREGGAPASLRAPAHPPRPTRNPPRTYLCLASRCRSSTTHRSRASRSAPPSARRQRRLGVPAAAQSGGPPRSASSCSSTLMCLANSLPILHDCGGGAGGGAGGRALASRAPSSCGARPFPGNPPTHPNPPYTPNPPC